MSDVETPARELVVGGVVVSIRLNRFFRKKYGKCAPVGTQAGAGFEAIESLAETCRTSITATAIRFAQYAEDPVAVLLSNGQTIDCCFMSDALRDVEGLKWIKKGALVPPRSETAKFNKVASNTSSGRKSGGWASLDDWFDGAPQVEMKEDVVGLPLAPTRSCFDNTSSSSTRPLVALSAGIGGRLTINAEESLRPPFRLFNRLTQFNAYQTER